MTHEHQVMPLMPLPRVSSIRRHLCCMPPSQNQTKKASERRTPTGRIEGLPWCYYVVWCSVATRTSKYARDVARGRGGGVAVSQSWCESVGQSCSASENLMLCPSSVIASLRTYEYRSTGAARGARGGARPCQPPLTFRLYSYLSHSSRHQEEQCHIRRPSAPYC